ncbi:uncharacterized protein LOC105020396 [Arapaima gigas]
MLRKTQPDRRESTVIFFLMAQQWTGVQCNNIRAMQNLEEYFGSEPFYGDEYSCEEEPQSQPSSARGSHFRWWLWDGEQHLYIDNGLVIEAHYCQPGAKGIQLFTSSCGQIYIDFDKMEIQGSHFSVHRQTILSSDEKEEIGWYYKDNRRWYEYGTQGSAGVRSSVNSGDIEQEYNRCPEGTVHFTTGSMSYSIDFTAMTQRNLTTGMTRQVRRRPKFNCVIKVNASQTTLSNRVQLSDSLPSADQDWKWQFLGANARWTDYSSTDCSLNSDMIEKLYQQNPHHQLKFTAGRFSYTLDLTGMCQTNNATGTRRPVRRIPSGTESTTSRCRWQFKDVGGVWRDFTKDGCSVSSEDIETMYLQDSSGTVTFRAGRFTYELSFSAMTQRNLSTNTTRESVALYLLPLAGFARRLADVLSGNPQDQVLRVKLKTARYSRAAAQPLLGSERPLVLVMKSFLRNAPPVSVTFHTTGCLGHGKRKRRVEI